MYFPEHHRLQIKTSDTALTSTRVKITFELDESSAKRFQRRVHIKHYQNAEQILGALCLINAENQYEITPAKAKCSQIPLFEKLITDQL